VDGNFCHAALENKIHIREQLPKLLGGSCKELVTPCVLEELKSLGETFRGALMIAKRFEVRSCRHQDHLRVAHECLASLVEQNNNPNHYIVATQDVQLRKRLRHCPAIPLLYVHYNVMIMEPPGEASKNVARLIDQTKLVPKEHERRFIGHLQNHDIENMPNTTVSISKRKFTRKRKAKAPNPLSVLKKRKKSLPKTPNKSVR
jgi:U3 small nucleolar RNA-associated protein 23